jgi:hypothetical protein
MMPLFPCFTGNSISFAAILTDQNHGSFTVIPKYDLGISILLLDPRLKYRDAKSHATFFVSGLYLVSLNAELLRSQNFLTSQIRES